MNNYIEALQWRYATKKFDPTRKISDEDIKYLKDAVQLSVSSYGLQPYTVIVVKDQSTKEKLREAGYNQSQITDSSHLFVFAHQTDFGEELVNTFIDSAAEIRKMDKKDLKPYEDMMKNSLIPLPQETKSNWTARQAYIAMGTLISAAALKNIDACPMEGFQNEDFNKILNLTDRNLNAVAITAVGYRSAEDEAQHYAKVRREQQTLFETI